MLSYYQTWNSPCACTSDHKGDDTMRIPRKLLPFCTMLLLLLCCTVCAHANEVIFSMDANAQESVINLSGTPEDAVLLTSDALYRVKAGQVEKILDHQEAYASVSFDGETTLLLDREGTIWVLQDDGTLGEHGRVKEDSLDSFDPMRVSHLGDNCFVLVRNDRTGENSLLYHHGSATQWMVIGNIVPLDVAICGEGQAFLLLEDGGKTCVGKLVLSEKSWDIVSECDTPPSRLKVFAKQPYTSSYRSVMQGNISLATYWNIIDFVLDEHSILIATSKTLVRLERNGEKTVSQLSVRYASVIDPGASNDYYLQTGVQIVDSDVQDVAQALITRDSSVDLFIIATQEELVNLKKGKYYVPLNDSQILQEQSSLLYDRIRAALYDGDSLMCWPISVLPVVSSMEDKIRLEKLGFSYPTTYDEFLDVAAVLPQCDWWDDSYAITGYRFNQETVLTSFIQRYLFEMQASDLEHPSFNTETFRRLVERIRQEVPKDATLPADTARCLLNLDAYARPELTSDMLPPITIEPSARPAVQVDMWVALVNPYSPNQAQAVAFLEYLAQRRDQSSYTCYQLPPLENESVLRELAEKQSRLDELKGQAASGDENAKDAQVQYDALKQEIEALSANTYLVSPDMLAAYAELAKGFVIQETSSLVDYATLQKTIRMYLSDAISMEEFIRRLDEQISMRLWE